MRRLQTLVRVGAALAAATLFATQAMAVTLHIQNGGDPSSLDPHKVSGDWENRIVGDIFEGLVTDDPRALPMPGMATSWDISDDGLVYTFHLREGAVWSDGKPVVASDFAFALKHLDRNRRLIVLGS